MRDIIGEQQQNIKGDHADLWAQIQQTVRNRQQDYFSIAWVPSHTDTEKAQEAEARGGHKQSMILGNQAADNEAKS